MKMLLERQKKKDSSDSSSLKNLFRKRSYFLLLWLDSFFFWFFLFLHEGVTSIVVVFSSLETWEHGLWSELRNPKKLLNNKCVKIELVMFRIQRHFVQDLSKIFRFFYFFVIRMLTFKLVLVDWLVIVFDGVQD